MEAKHFISAISIICYAWTIYHVFKYGKKRDIYGSSFENYGRKEAKNMCVFLWMATSYTIVSTFLGVVYLFAYILSLIF